MYLFHYHWLSLCKLDRRSVLAFENLSRQVCVGRCGRDILSGTRRDAELRRAITSVRPRTIRISFLDTSVRYSPRVAHARFIIHFAGRQLAARSWFLRLRVRPFARELFFFSFSSFIPLWIWYTWNSGDDRRRQCIKRRRARVKRSGHKHSVFIGARDRYTICETSDGLNNSLSELDSSYEYRIHNRHYEYGVLNSRMDEIDVEYYFNDTSCDKRYAGSLYGTCIAINYFIILNFMKYLNCMINFQINMNKKIFKLHSTAIYNIKKYEIIENCHNFLFEILNIYL